MTNDLLPCPFCQKDARIVKEGRNFENRPLYAIACKRHRCKVSTPTQTTLAAAIKIWNHRADLVSTPTKSAEVDLDALRGHLERAKRLTGDAYLAADMNKECDAAYSEVCKALKLLDGKNG